jgi:protein TonB
MKSFRTSAASPRRFVSVAVVAGLHLIVIWALASGLASQLIQKLPDELNTEVIKDKPPEQNKVPPPPPPELIKPPPPFVPPPDINVQVETTTNNAIQTQSVIQHDTPKPSITAPASTGSKHSCSGEKYYPPIAKRLNWTGTTGLTFHIAVDGTPKDFSVTTSSGHDELDQAAITCVSSWHYKPAIQNNNPVEVPWQTSIKWNLAGG